MKVIRTEIAALTAWIVFVFMALLFMPSPDGLAATPQYPVIGALSARVVNSQVRLTWPATHDPDFKFYYFVQSPLNRLPEYPNDPAVWSTNDPNETTYNDALNPDGPMFYRVCAINTSNNVSCSNVVEVEPSGTVYASRFFNDLERESWYEPFVQELYRKSIVVNSNNDLRFRPAFNTTRGDLAEMVVRAIVPDLSTLVSQSSFCDVSASSPQAKYIHYLKTAGIVEGYPGGTCASGRLFKPAQTISRAEALKMTMFAMQATWDPGFVTDDSRPYQDTDLYTDVHQSDWFAGWVYRAKDDAIISGYPDDTFKPFDPINRAETAKVIFNTLKMYQQI